MMKPRKHTDVMMRMLRRAARARREHGMALLFTLCILSSGVYVLNDIVDVNADRNHPQKKYRPIAAGKISLKNAKIFCQFKKKQYLCSRF